MSGSACFPFVFSCCITELTTPPTFANITEAGKQAGISRLYGGIHYRPSIEAGFESGKKTADAIHRSIKFER
jgi:hypothetical protein